MNSKEKHGSDCTCSECVLGQDEIVVDLTPLVIKEEVFALNEKTHGSCQTVFKSKETMLDRTTFVESNDGDPDLVLYIPFSSQVNIRSMTMIGGENGTSPGKVKLFINRNESDIDFDLKDAEPTQEIDCIENKEGKVPYFLRANKFNSVWSITIVVCLNYHGDNTKIYYIGFEGTDKHKKKKFKLELATATKFPDVGKIKEEPPIHVDTIYG